jgi:hypothetical protein
VASYFFPRESTSFSPSSGTSDASSPAVASPRAASAFNAAFSTFRSQGPVSATMPASVRNLTRRARSRTATAWLAAHCTTGARSTGSTNNVRRMASMRSTVRSSYSASSTAAIDGFFIRAAADRYSDAGSVACSPTRSCATSTTLDALDAGASR